MSADGPPHRARDRARGVATQATGVQCDCQATPPAQRGDQEAERHRGEPTGPGTGARAAEASGAAGEAQDRPFVGEQRQEAESRQDRVGGAGRHAQPYDQRVGQRGRVDRDRRDEPGQRDRQDAAGRQGRRRPRRRRSKAVGAQQRVRERHARRSEQGGRGEQCHPPGGESADQGGDDGEGGEPEVQADGAGEQRGHAEQDRRPQQRHRVQGAEPPFGRRRRGGECGRARVRRRARGRGARAGQPGGRSRGGVRAGRRPCAGRNGCVPRGERARRGCRGRRSQADLAGAQGADEQRVVGGEHDRSAGVPMVGDEPDDLGPGGRVLTEGGLVQHEDPGVEGQRRAHAQPPLLAPGEGERVGLGEVGQAQAVEQPLGARVRLRVRHAGLGEPVPSPLGAVVL